MMTMAILRGVHLVALILWGGSVTADGLLELYLRRERSRDGQLALMRLHRMVDLLLEGPAAILVVASGFALAMGRPTFTPLFIAKAVCGFLAVFANLISIGIVVGRARWATQLSAGMTPLSTASGQLYGHAVLTTLIGVPFGMAALAIALHGF